MTDNKIVKALKELLETALYNGDLQSSGTISNALDLINRQKAKIERLEAECQMADGYADALVKMTKAEAIKDFAERLNEKKRSVCAGHGICEDIVDKYTIDNLVKEMIGEQ